MLTAINIQWLNITKHPETPPAVFNLRTETTVKLKFSQLIRVRRLILFKSVSADCLNRTEKRFSLWNGEKYVQISLTSNKAFNKYKTNQLIIRAN